jgi:hypothetical protein
MQQVHFLIHDVPGSAKPPRRVYRPRCAQEYTGARSVPGLSREIAVKSTASLHHNSGVKCVMRVVTKRHYQFAALDAYDALSALIGNLTLTGVVRQGLMAARNSLEKHLIADGVL